MDRDEEKRVLIDDDGIAWRWTREQLEAQSKSAADYGDTIGHSLADEAILLMIERDELLEAEENRQESDRARDQVLI